MTSMTTAVILAAGMGTRMKSRSPKAMQRLANRPMVTHVIEMASAIVDRIVVVVGPDMTELEETVAPHQTVVQKERLGTGHAALTAMPYVGEGDVVFLYADNPLLTSRTLERLLRARQNGARLSLLGMRPANPAHYGRLVAGRNGTIERIVEYKDASPEERAITLCNAGMMCADASLFRQWLEKIEPNNAQGEYYLTDVVSLASSSGEVCCVEGDENELIGVNSRMELARAEALLQDRLRLQAMENGATLVDPASIFLSADTQISPDVTIEPHVFLGPQVILREGCTIRAFSHLEGCIVEANAAIGPYARLRPGTTCSEGSHVGNFVELKNTVLGEGSKANHLSYLGDTTIGEKTNIGAGTITCNYDGVFKHKTTIGNNSFVGSNSIIVAPVTVGDNTLIAAGSVITENIPNKAMALGRAKQVIKAERGLAYQRALKTKKEQS
ncbi:MULTISPECIES: bifunctional UDP-N-acetylglucosamine diphosphorylase/glucosamine-1-phosphate N-acetyltransferase GlmU [unclassified Saccharibacter]|uniref:bifunctional UDP-N-acetylglucosamine diphosphorylase/glucosamine-1-phosphate N-acetyltransferase GlmU n=1 Tax=unclassified Saccharibacter TaxID=2648722 RepID=UPI0013257030|nr:MULTISPECIES: bifunctional UDP-N-acetylglucosamine diphosphorylase/glucosamine-1-phosphate N-acetyltransferase GlmU [unclassified Saccharibacter]MXV35286.1 bifunctional UDP-N-acetylglucosamine diphosphorylase/glucosamine-1-phosphate N-acetyltransferase GlmU [Saccharibacter sp. EH611]MXV57866.1 bifunctional UDP-N-acetylglucosamine diphosphorylase/glucosamine-1-phosphate N-acetyltransferase GlmU [Saccharibacter sp. EH70]MXV65220.1 bifunctional UDP-N-acetylglucosamine diphosphorylase/glucosamine